MSEPERSTDQVGAAPTSDGARPLPSDLRVGEQGAASVGAAPLTGDDAVDEALRLLGEVELQDLRTQVATFEDVHGALQDRLADAEG
ncbi:hypothetical protein [Cellulomonas xiejunii]|uniref:FXSXX-COOH protein n=1 Tax=Cellulomonas xiejunii TaxID=2968083 RepID=A0ABY5KW37_9CELL|nr:hypothetical protein [Cellulomonas xiejunii]MCC2314624.1 hypothetical protein [Cellulomonas xiejunii]MCC2322901.1 hypothetical protein [Cellulomonas xiejunii]UUI73401.1 hypothetical protein NP048_08235 [Cellulomonas xiejunii]